ncbi:hypothetical protein ACFL4T_06775 [candidate division KSB1 bacterium]
MKEFFADNLDFIIIFAASNALIVIIMGFVTYFMLKREKLRGKGYKDEYITFAKKYSDFYGLRIFIVLIIAQIISSVIVYLISGELTVRSYSRFVWPITFVLSLPFAIYFGKKANIGYKELAQKTNSDIIVDFKYKTLNLIFRKYLEIPVTILIVLFTLFNIRFEDQGIVYIYIILPWLFFYFVRNYKNLEKAVFKDTYKKLFLMTHLYQGILIALIILEASVKFEVYNWYNYAMLGVLSLLLIIKLIYYISRYPALKKQLELINNNTAEAAAR